MPLYIIGLDGATWDILDPLLQQGVMPRLQALIRQGMATALESTWPPVTALAWPTCYTGQNAGKHGVFSFVRLDAAGQERVVDGRAVAAPALWDWATAAGLKVGVSGVPVTYPARPVAGFMISDFLTPPGADDAFYPADLAARLSPWTFHVPPIEAQPTVENTRDFIAHLTSVAARQFDALQTLLDEHRPDLFFGVWMHPDTLQHAYCGYLHPQHPLFARPETPALRAILAAAFRQLDDFIGRLAERALPDGNLLILSDHGFGPVHRRLALNNALARHGFLRLHRGRMLSHRLGRRLRRGLGWRQDEAEESMRHVKRQAGQSAYIDWPHTRAFSGALHEMCIHLHRADRYPTGIVRPADIAPLLADVSAMLLALRDEAGQPLLAAVYRPEELFSGPYLGQAPDLFLRPHHPGDIITDGLLRGGRLYRSEAARPGGWHRREGILAAAGRDIRQGGAPAARPTLADIAPTALRLLGFAPPGDMDGRVLEELLLPPAAPLPDLPAMSNAANRPGEALAAGEEAALLARLRGLGYLN